MTYFGANADLKRQLPHDAALHQKSRAGRPTKSIDWLLTASTNLAEGQQISLEYDGKSHQAKLNLQGIYNAYNALAALAAVANLPGIKLGAALKAIGQVGPAFGRTEFIHLSNGKKVQLLLVKNPAGFNQIIKTFLLARTDLPVLMAINDNFADGRDVSWLWDVDFEQLKDQRHGILTSGIRGYDLANRLKYTDISSQTDTNLSRALKRFTADLGEGETGYIVPTYTAMLAIRKLLRKQADVTKEWQL